MNTTRADLIAMAETLRRARGHLLAAVNAPRAVASPPPQRPRGGRCAPW